MEAGNDQGRGLEVARDPEVGTVLGASLVALGPSPARGPSHVDVTARAPAQGPVTGAATAVGPAQGIGVVVVVAVHGPRSATVTPARKEGGGLLLVAGLAVEAAGAAAGAAETTAAPETGSAAAPGLALGTREATTR